MFKTFITSTVMSISQVSSTQTQPDVETYVQTPDANLICCICVDILTKPQRTPCGHVFCNDCICDWLSLDKKNCVACREPLNFDDLQSDRIIESLIGNLEVRCPNTECAWRGKSSRQSAHLRECDEEQVVCTHHEFGCEFTGKQCDLKTIHLKQCKYEPLKDLLREQRDAAKTARKRVREMESRVSLLETVIEQRSGRWLRDVSVDHKIDAKDRSGRWYEATVIGIPADGDSLKVHFDGWGEKHDEVLRLDGGRLAPLHAHSFKRRKRRRTVRNWREFEEGDVVDCRDSVDKWYEAVVVEVNEEESSVFVHYEGWPTMWDEWIGTKSQRLAPLRTHSSPTPRRGGSTLSSQPQQPPGTPETPSIAPLQTPELLRLLLSSVQQMQGDRE
jgi:hypothetical protein